MKFANFIPIQAKSTINRKQLKIRGKMMIPYRLIRISYKELNCGGSGSSCRQWLKVYAGKTSGSLLWQGSDKRCGPPGQSSQLRLQSKARLLSQHHAPQIFSISVHPELEGITLPHKAYSCDL